MLKTSVTTLFAMLMCHSVFASTPSPEGLIGGVGLDRTRIVMENGEKTSVFGVVNSMPNTIAVMSWVSDAEGKPAEAFAVSPSVYQLGAGKTGKGTIRLLSELPQDRESVFYLVVNTSEAGNTEKHHMKVAVGHRIKLFYRPDGLKGDTKFAAERLVWSVKRNELTVKNPTPFSVSISEVFDKQKQLKLADIVLPFSELSWSIDSSKLDFKSIKSFTFVDEFGGFVEVPLKLGTS